MIQARGTIFGRSAGVSELIHTINKLDAKAKAQPNTATERRDTKSPSIQQHRHHPPGHRPQDRNELMAIIMMLVALLSQLIGNKGHHHPGDSRGTDLPGTGSASGYSPTQGPVSGMDSGHRGHHHGSTMPTSALTRFDGVNDPRLQNHINQLATDPEGRNLLEEARRRGVSIAVGQPVEGALAHFDPNNNTVVLGHETMNRGTGLQSLIHELVHATTPGDGNSQHEEGMANVIADRISARINGRQPRNADSIYSSTLANYGELSRFNHGFMDNIRRVLGNRPSYAGLGEVA